MADARQEDAKENDEKLKEQEKEATEIAKGAENLYFSANKYKQAGDYKTAIKYYEYSLKANDTYKFREDAIYNMALSYQKLGDDDNAIKYYKKFVNTYKASSNFYDDSYYHLGMLYYKNDRLQDAKNAFYDLRGSDPNSPYNNSEKVKEILRK